jgi:hypothetical protein
LKQSFKFQRCLPVLHESPKFDHHFSNLLEDDTDEGVQSNRLHKPQESGLEKPLGRDKAKKIAKEVASYATVLASKHAGQQGHLDKIAKAMQDRNRILSSIMTLQRTQEALLVKHQMFMAMENYADALKVMGEIEAMNAVARAEETAHVNAAAVEATAEESGDST